MSASTGARRRRSTSVSSAAGEERRTSSSSRRTSRSCPKRPGWPRPACRTPATWSTALDLEGRLKSDPRPKLVLSGHIHARCSTHDGPLLQFTVGALIEPPFDATLVEIDGTSVRRTARRLGEIAVTDPVFAADDERWQWTGDRWELQPPASSAASTRAVSQT